MSQNKFAGKYMDGTFAHGEGPVAGLDINNERENPGLLTGGEGGGKNLKTVDGPTTFKPATGDDGLFSLRGKDYVGPENWQPTSDGVSNPFDIK